MTSSGIEPATFQFVAKCVYRVPPSPPTISYNMIKASIPQFICYSFFRGLAICMKLVRKVTISGKERVLLLRDDKSHFWFCKTFHVLIIDMTTVRRFFTSHIQLSALSGLCWSWRWITMFPEILEHLQHTKGLNHRKSSYKLHLWNMT
jgi:hypothetical protein